jgi:hypothetical protein
VNIIESCGCNKNFLSDKSCILTGTGPYEIIHESGMNNIFEVQIYLDCLLLVNIKSNGINVAILVSQTVKNVL